MEQRRSIEQSRRRLDYASRIAPDILVSDEMINHVAAFGSTVEGGERYAAPDSDLDIATIWLNEAPEERMLANRTEQENRYRGGEFPISITPMRLSDFEKPNTPFHMEVKRTAIKLAIRE